MEELPAEIQMKILMNLCQPDLCSVALVNKHFKALALDQSLWTELTINRSVMEKLKRECANLLLLQCNRFSNIKSLKIEVEELPTNEIITVLAMSLKFNTIVEIDTSHNDLSEIPIALLTVVFHKVEKLNLCGTDLTKDQIIVLLKESVKTNSLIELNLSENDLKDVPQELLAAAMTKFKKIELSDTNLTTDQLSVILRETAKSDSLIDLNLQYNSFDNVPADLFSKGISKLKRLDLESTKLSTEQLTAILTETCKSDSLIELNLGHRWEGNAPDTIELGFREVPKELLAKAISKLKKVDLVGTKLSIEQLVAILEQTGKSKSLVELELSRNCFGSSVWSDIDPNPRVTRIGREVPTEALAKAVSKLKKIDLYCTNLTTEQLVAILEAASKSSSLNELNLGCNRLDKVPKELLVKVIPKLEKFCLCQTCLTTEQIVAILEEALKSNPHIEMRLGHNSFGEVPTQLFEKAISKWRYLKL